MPLLVWYSINNVAIGALKSIELVCLNNANNIRKQLLTSIKLVWHDSRCRAKPQNAILSLMLCYIRDKMVFCSFKNVSWCPLVSTMMWLVCKIAQTYLGVLRQLMWNTGHTLAWHGPLATFNRTTREFCWRLLLHGIVLCWEVSLKGLPPVCSCAT